MVIYYPLAYETTNQHKRCKLIVVLKPNLLTEQRNIIPLARNIPLGDTSYHETHQINFATLAYLFRRGSQTTAMHRRQCRAASGAALISVVLGLITPLAQHYEPW